MFKFTLFALIIALLAYFEQCSGHGMLLDPPGRSSRWRFDRTAPVNYNDNSLSCGGFRTQWIKHNGKCGMCGDDYGQASPRDNELGGRYGQGVITKTYGNSQVIDVAAKITANRLGYIYYHLCNLDEFGGVESEDCYLKYHLKFADGKDIYKVGTHIGMIHSKLVLPKGLTCKHCVLRWTYRTGNSWGMCDDGSGAFGCGPQEYFISCADFSITPAAGK